jgi:hypothetical protein
MYLQCTGSVHHPSPPVNHKEWFQAILGVAHLGGFANTFKDGKNIADSTTGLTQDTADQREMKAHSLIS